MAIVTCLERRDEGWLSFVNSLVAWGPSLGPWGHLAMTGSGQPLTRFGTACLLRLNFKSRLRLFRSQEENGGGRQGKRNKRFRKDGEERAPELAESGHVFKL